MLWVTSSGLRGSLISGASLVTMRTSLLTVLTRSTPPSEVMRPPSNAAVAFVCRNDGSENGSRVSCPGLVSPHPMPQSSASTPRFLLQLRWYQTSQCSSTTNRATWVGSHPSIAHSRSTRLPSQACKAAPTWVGKCETMK